MFRILFLIWFSFHPVHVSLTSIDYVPETNDFKGFVRVYLTDFIPDSKKSADNGEAVTGKLKDVEVSLVDNEVNINLLFSNGKNPEKVTIKNLIMTDLYHDQANMTIIKVNDFEQGVTLTPEMTESTFKIK